MRRVVPTGAKAAEMAKLRVSLQNNSQISAGDKALQNQWLVLEAALVVNNPG